MGLAGWHEQHWQVQSFAKDLGVEISPEASDFSHRMMDRSWWKVWWWLENKPLGVIPKYHHFLPKYDHFRPTYYHFGAWFPQIHGSFSHFGVIQSSSPLPHLHFRVWWGHEANLEIHRGARTRGCILHQVSIIQWWRGRAKAKELWQLWVMIHIPKWGAIKEATATKSFPSPHTTWLILVDLVRVF